MTTTLIEIDRWSHDCCGEELSQGMRVTLNCRLPVGYDLLRSVDLVADSHSGNLPFISCTGDVVQITMTDDHGTPQPIQRLPSGRALRGFDDLDDGAIQSADTGNLVDRDGPRRFYVEMRAVALTEVDEKAWAAMQNAAVD